MKIAFTGTHGTGKTTAVYRLAERMKIKHPAKRVGVFVDSTRCIPAGLTLHKGATVESELWIFCDRIRGEIEHCSRNDIVICDRTIVDPIAYAHVAGHYDLVRAEKSLALVHLLAMSYDRVIFKSAEKNQYGFSDGVRDGKAVAFREEVEHALRIIWQEMIAAVPIRFEFEKE